MEPYPVTDFDMPRFSGATHVHSRIVRWMVVISFVQPISHPILQILQQCRDISYSSNWLKSGMGAQIHCCSALWICSIQCTHHALLISGLQPFLRREGMTGEISMILQLQKSSWGYSKSCPNVWNPSIVALWSTSNISLHGNLVTLSPASQVHPNLMHDQQPCMSPPQMPPPKMIS